MRRLQLAPFDFATGHRRAGESSGASSLDMVIQAKEAESCDAMTTMAGATETAAAFCVPRLRQMMKATGSV